jgi:hypothetical protein
MKYLRLMAYGSVIGNFLYKSFRKLSFPITGKKETVLYIHYSTCDGTPREEVVIILYVGKLADFSDVNRFLRKIGECITAPGWRMDEVIMRDMISTSQRDDDIDGLDRCLLNQHEIDKFKDAYYTLVGPSCD